MRSAVASDVCRVAVQGLDRRLDLALPANVVVAEVIPLVVEAVQGSTAWQRVPTDWELSRLDGSRLSTEHSIQDNGVRDGELLLLNRVRTTAATPSTDDLIAAIPPSLATPPWTPTAARAVASLVSLCCSGLAAYALIRSDAPTSAIIAWVLSGLTFVGLVVHSRIYDESLVILALAVAAIVCAAVGGYHTVRGDAAAPKLLLAAASATTASVLAARCTASGTSVFTGISSIGFISAIGASTALFVPTRISATGAVIAATAAGTLIMAARLAIWISGLEVPQLPGSPARRNADTAIRDFATGARRAHAITTGLICGASATAVLGATVSTFGDQFRGGLLAAVMGLVLLTRASIHADLVQAWALIAGGVACFGMLFVYSVHLHRQDAHWISLGAAGVGAAVIALARPQRWPSPLVRRGMELIEYAALAAVAPLACWTLGVFGAVRGLA
jgi:type VII secretion integral membrane protein EccD